MAGKPDGGASANGFKVQRSNSSGDAAKVATSRASPQLADQTRSMTTGRGRRL